MLGVELVHHGFHEQHTGRLTGGDRFTRLGRCQCGWFFAEHVLAGARGLDRPFGVTIVGQRQVHRIDRRIGQQFVVIAIAGLETEAFHELTRYAATTGQRIRVAVTGGQDGRNRVFAGDFGGTEHAPVDQGPTHNYLLRTTMRPGGSEPGANSRIYFLYIYFATYLFYTLVRTTETRSDHQGEA